MDIGMAAHDITKAAVNGSYDQNFFGEIDSDAPLISECNVKRLRAAIQDQNLAIAERMRKTGHKFEITQRVGEPALASEEGHGKDVDTEEDQPGAFSTGYHSDFTHVLAEPSTPPEKITLEDNLPRNPVKLTRAEATTWVLKILRRSRGHELPGTYNPLLISTLFWEQSSRWLELAMTPR